MFSGGGTHVNISGAALARHAPHRDNAVKLLEYLVGDEAPHIRQTVEALALLDLIFARARYADELRASEPELVGFKEARAKRESGERRERGAAHRTTELLEDGEDPSRSTQHASFHSLWHSIPIFPRTIRR